MGSPMMHHEDHSEHPSKTRVMLTESVRAEEKRKREEKKLSISASRYLKSVKGLSFKFIFFVLILKTTS